MIQSLHENVTGAQVNTLLAEGAVVAHIQRAEPDVVVTYPDSEPHQRTGVRWHVVLDTPDPGDIVDEATVVLRFLHGINPVALQEAMDSRIRLSEGPALSALQALAAMVHPEPPDGPPGA